jgi:hypothetical protein
MSNDRDDIAAALHRLGEDSYDASAETRRMSEEVRGATERVSGISQWWRAEVARFDALAEVAEPVEPVGLFGPLPMATA